MLQQQHQQQQLDGSACLCITLLWTRFQCAVSCLIKLSVTCINTRLQLQQLQECSCSNPPVVPDLNVMCTAATWCKPTHVYIRWQHTGSAEEQEQQQQLEGLLESAARMLPAAQQGLATAPHQTHGGPALALTTTTAAGQVTASCPNPVKTCFSSSSNTSVFWFCFSTIESV